MNSSQHMVIQGAILGCLLLATFGWIVSANAASLQSPQPENPITFNTSNAILPPMVERLNDQANDPEKDTVSEETFEDSLGYTPALDNQPDEPIQNMVGICQVSAQFPQNILDWCSLITHYAAQNNLEPNLIAAVILQESGGQPLAYSHSGAVGLMQVMPRDGIAANFMCKNGPCFSNRPSTSELQDPQFNIAYGTRMLAGLKDRFGNIRDALKSYGPMDVGYSYADKVLAILDRYGE